ncbi:MAG: hypothetical protein WBA46_07035 [Thermomicrobiales bacterium]
MTIPTLSDAQRRHLGTLIWTHVDGVAGNVNTLLGAINRDVVSGVRVVATHEWEKASAALRALQDLAKQLDEHAPTVSVEQMRTQLRELAATVERIAPRPTVRTPVV